MCKCTPAIRKPFCGGPGCEVPPLDRERSRCDDVPDEDCSARPGCRRPDGSWCPAYPEAHHGRRA